MAGDIAAGQNAGSLVDATTGMAGAVSGLLKAQTVIDVIEAVTSAVSAAQSASEALSNGNKNSE